jgi:hypothetical protein
MIKVTIAFPNTGGTAATGADTHDEEFAPDVRERLDDLRSALAEALADEQAGRAAGLVTEFEGPAILTLFVHEEDAIDDVVQPVLDEHDFGDSDIEIHEEEDPAATGPSA